MGNIKICPICGEQIKVEAKKCRYCGSWLVDESKDNAQDFAAIQDEHQNEEAASINQESLESEEIHKSEKREKDNRENIENKSKNQKKKDKVSLLLMKIFALLLVLVLVILLFVIPKIEERKSLKFKISQQEQDITEYEERIKELDENINNNVSAITKLQDDILSYQQLLDSKNDTLKLTNNNENEK